MYRSLNILYMCSIIICSLQICGTSQEERLRDKIPSTFYLNFTITITIPITHSTHSSTIKLSSTTTNYSQSSAEERKGTR